MNWRSLIVDVVILLSLAAFCYVQGDLAAIPLIVGGVAFWLLLLHLAGRMNRRHVAALFFTGMVLMCAAIRVGQDGDFRSLPDYVAVCALGWAFLAAVQRARPRRQSHRG